MESVEGGLVAHWLISARTVSTMWSLGTGLALVAVGGPPGPVRWGTTPCASGGRWQSVTYCLSVHTCTYIYIYTYI